MLDISDHFTGRETRALPVGDPLKQKTGLLREGFSHDEISGAYLAWNFLDAALQSAADRRILKRCKSPREAFGQLESWHDPESEVTLQNLYDQFHDFSIPPRSNPIAALHALEDINNRLEEKSMVRIPDSFLHARCPTSTPMPRKYCSW
ncbi:unnamed protein product [Pylaiella littoralis]